MKNFIKKALLIAFIANLPSFAHVFSMGEKPKEPKLPAELTLEIIRNITLNPRITTLILQNKDILKELNLDPKWQETIANLKYPAQQPESLELSKLPSELQTLIRAKSLDEWKNLRLVNREWKEDIDQLINNIKEKSEKLVSKYPFLEKLDKNVLYNIVKKVYIANYPYMDEVDSYFENLINSENQIKEENNFETFNTLDDNSKDLIRALYFLDTDNILLDGKNYTQELMKDIKDKFVKVKIRDYLSLGGKLKALTDNDQNILLRLIMLVFPNLKRLYLQSNNLTTLPKLNLPALEDLNLDNNQLTTLPELNLPNLKRLDLYNNQLTTLPELNLPALEGLNLRNNQLTTLPELNLPNLKQLYLNNNEISKSEIVELKIKLPSAFVNE